MKMFINKSTISPYILYGVLELYSNSCTWSSMQVGLCNTTAHFRSSTTLLSFFSQYL